MIGKKLVCKHKKMDKEDFMENISDFDSRFELFFLYWTLCCTLCTMVGGHYVSTGIGKVILVQKASCLPFSFLLYTSCYSFSLLPSFLTVHDEILNFLSQQQENVMVVLFRFQFDFQKISLIFPPTNGVFHEKVH